MPIIVTLVVEHEAVIWSAPPTDAPYYARDPRALLEAARRRLLPQVAIMATTMVAPWARASASTSNDVSPKPLTEKTSRTAP